MIEEPRSKAVAGQVAEYNVHPSPDENFAPGARDVTTPCSIAW
jgi:hypothetical protein